MTHSEIPQPKLPDSEQPKKGKKVQPEKLEPVFATEEELAQKEELIHQLKELELKNDNSIEGLQGQKEILIKLHQLNQKREERIAGEKGEQFDATIGIFTNIRFKETEDKRTGNFSYISRYPGRKLVVLKDIRTMKGERIDVSKSYKAKITGIFKDGKVIYVRIIE